MFLFFSKLWELPLLSVPYPAGGQCRMSVGEKCSQGDPLFVPSTIHPLFHSQMSPSVDLAVALYLTFTGVMSLVGNGMVLLVSGRRRRKLRPPELLTINLALCDFGFSLFGAPFFIISSVSHAWLFGDMGCLYYGIQGFVFGIGSLLTTCLISLDRCLKICCLQYGQWIEKRYVCLSIALMWVYTLFWGLLPAFGFGSYGPEPYGTSCTINWWRMTSSLNDRRYISLILSLCFGFPTLIIITSYLAILLMVCRSSRAVAAISSSFVSRAKKDLRLAKVAAVVCTTFLVAWTPYAVVSLISVFVPRDDQEPNVSLKTLEEESTGVSSSSQNALRILDIPSLFNLTATEYSKQVFSNHENSWSEVFNMSSPSSLDKQLDAKLRSPQPPSSLPPLVTLIPALFAKSHCMVNPFIYQIMNKEFRRDVCDVVLRKDRADRRRVPGGMESLNESASASPTARAGGGKEATQCPTEGTAEE
ncbi:opsin 9 [Antennarius striatus]|uniref:opsin 9 n=1 Tax=Antennarius striatus TaxID=241820 RepID=UPI0035B2D8F2